MPTSLRHFHVSLYREHLDEASFLYDQRLAYLDDPAVDWPDLHDWEERLEAHIDALTLGGDLALDVCRERVIEGDRGEKYATVCVLCRQDRKAEVFSILTTLEPDPAVTRAVTDALCREASSYWKADLLQAFRRDEGGLVGMFARVMAYRRFPVEEAVAARLAERPEVGRADLAWALGRLGTSRSTTLLRSFLEDHDARVREMAAIALMRLGDDSPVSLALSAVSTEQWAQRVLAIGGSRRAVEVLLNELEAGRATPDTIRALGLLGDLDAIDPLVRLLDDELLGESSAIALNTITGAQLHTIVFVPDRIDPLEVEQDRGENRRVYGNRERRPVTDKAQWRSWLDNHKQNFHRPHRWRMGSPHGPMALVRCLSSPTSSFEVRASTYEELVSRFGLTVPFEVDLPVAQQHRFLHKIDSWAAEHAASFDKGIWYFAQREQNSNPEPPYHR